MTTTNKQQALWFARLIAVVTPPAVIIGLVFYYFLKMVAEDAELWRYM